MRKVYRGSWTLTRPGVFFWPLYDWFQINEISFGFKQPLYTG
ncbi:hypothetical protein SBF1_620008 [Candidatus Desulfosporosinus infrequens]|uniref:Uncharacterized protein n=1 Tax=Candidatus Desulfosporosinus infrequens TaxID=2043169 RepID=A0A2U3LLR7_9FIRM|nr:hypothetical protein SBF1_620008 [Candidatus Desulfosporosinus infrequens]